MSVRAVILGFGTVGQGVYNIIQQKGAELAVQCGGSLEVVGVLIKDAARAGRALPEGMDASLLSDKPEEVLHADRRIDIVFEAMVGEEPAHALAVRAIQDLKVRAFITANKVMFAKYGVELQALAQAVASDGARPAFIGYEACVAGGVPVIKTLQNMLTVQRVSKIEGILNGTTNFILTDMREHPGKTFEATLAEAQERGYAEADPFNDVSGQDAFKKLMCVSSLVFGAQPDWESFPVIGIDTISAELVAEAAAKGERYRHVALVERVVDEGGAETISGAVRPQLVGPSHPLYGVEGVQNAVAVHTDYLGSVMLCGPGAGMYPTASVMMEDYAVFMRGQKSVQ